MIRPAALPPLIFAAMLAGCATSGGEYPSLAQRPAERAQGTLTPDAGADPIPASPAPSADLAARLADLLRQAQTLHAEFRGQVPAAERLAIAAGSRGSDSWASAEVALANLDAIRSRAAVALADLDALWIDATLEAGARDEIGAVRTAVEALIAQEDAELARLRSRL